MGIGNGLGAFAAGLGTGAITAAKVDAYRNESEKSKLQLERMTLHPNSFGQVSALAAFSGACDDWLAELLDYLTANRDFAVQYIDQELPSIHPTVPDATYLLWLDCHELMTGGRIPRDFSPYEFFLQKAKVGLNDGLPFGSGGENFVRLNFGCARSTLEQVLERMKKALA